MFFLWSRPAASRGRSVVLTGCVAGLVLASFAATPSLAKKRAPHPPSNSSTSPPAGSASGTDTTATGADSGATAPSVAAAPLEPTGAPTMPPYSAKDNFTFAVLGNSSPPAPGRPVPTTLFRIYEDLGVLRPDMVFHTGNFVWNLPNSQDGARTQLEGFRSFTDSLALPMFIAPGPKDIPDEDSDVAFRHAISGGKPWRSFDYGSSHFVVLDSEVPGEVGKVTGDQLSWLQDDLQAHMDAAHTFVFIHRSPYPVGDTPEPEAGFRTTTNRDDFAALMAKYHVGAVFSGSQPLYATSAHDGVNYVITGGGGSPTMVPPQDGGFLHYVLVAVNHDNVTVRPIQPARIDVRTNTELGSATVYNLSASPLILSRVGLLVPVKWRTKKVGLLGDDRLRVYDITAHAIGPDGEEKTVDAAPVDVTYASDKATLETNFDILYVRVQAPADSAISVAVKQAE